MSDELSDKQKLHFLIDQNKDLDKAIKAYKVTINQLKKLIKKQKKIIEWFAEEMLLEFGCPAADCREYLCDSTPKECKKIPEGMYECWIKYVKIQIEKEKNKN